MKQGKAKKTSAKKLMLVIILIIIAIAIVTLVIIANYFKVASSPGWHDNNGTHEYYVMENGERATGYRVIDSKAYLFDEEGRIITEKGWYDEKGKRSNSGSDLYSVGNGELASGWKYIEGKVRYFYQKEDLKSGRQLSYMAKDYITSGKIHIPSEGYIDGDEGLALAYGMDVLNRFGWDLESAYRYSASLRFIGGSEEHYGMTVHSCALQGFENGEGNCLAWAGTFCVMAKLLGKDCRLIWGTLQWNGTRPHAWTEIWDTPDVSDKEKHVCDPRKLEGEGLAGFYVHYGDKGTYKYDLDSREYIKW